MVLQPWAKYIIDQEIFMFKNSVKFFAVLNCRGFVHSANLLTVADYIGGVPGEFLAFSLLRYRKRYISLGVVVDSTLP